MQITLFTIFMSVLWSSVLAVFNYFCRKRQLFIKHIGIINVMVLYLFAVMRMLVPFNFSFTKIIHSEGVLNKLGADAYPLLLPSVVSVWAAVSTVLIVRFICRYLKAVKGFLAYGIREDEQCKRIFRLVSHECERRMRVPIRHSTDINIPMGIGVFRKSIILPMEEYSDSELYYILRHEYTHFQNRDLIIKILIHIYRCIFWWNPAIYLLEKNLARILEIRCDLNVTGSMQSRDKAEYLTTIVTMLKRAGTGSPHNVFCGVTALIQGNCEPEIIERFKIVSAGCRHKKRNRLFVGSWVLIFGLLILLSCSYVVQPEYKASASGITTETETMYNIRCIDNTYYVYFCK
ncbi:MAG: M56 family metallopeptidase [Lachnospiraceae bacterium]|nr:M56 family metallopeptidase [Lachnospiraceae bacterium]